MRKIDWMMYIENCATEVGDNYGYELVDFILQKYGASSIEELNPAYYEAVFNELYYYETELYN